MDALELFGEDGEGVVGGVADEEGEVDEVVWVGDLRDEVEVVVDVVCGIAQWGEQEDALFICGALWRRDDGVEVDELDGAGVDLDGGVVIKENGGCVGTP